MQQREEVFCKLMDAIEASLSVRAELDQALKAGHLNVARARYAMGPSSISQANYPSVIRPGIILLHASNASDDHPFNLAGSLESSKPEPYGSSTSNKQGEKVVSTPAPSASSDSSSQASALSEQGRAALDEADAQQLEAVAADAQGMHRRKDHQASEYSSSTISDLASKFDSSYTNTATSVQEVAPVTNPLRWFGYMVSPYLRQAQIHFAHAADTTVSLANMQYQITAALNELDKLNSKG